MQADIGVELAAREIAPERRPARAVGQHGHGRQPPRPQRLENAGADAMREGVIVRAKRDGFVFGHCFNALRGGVSHGAARVYSPSRAALFFRRRAKRKRN